MKTQRLIIAISAMLFSQIAKSSTEIKTNYDLDQITISVITNKEEVVNQFSLPKGVGFIKSEIEQLLEDGNTLVKVTYCGKNINNLFWARSENIYMKTKYVRSGSIVKEQGEPVYFSTPEKFDFLLAITLYLLMPGSMIFFCLVVLKPDPGFMQYFGIIKLIKMILLAFSVWLSVFLGYEFGGSISILALVFVFLLSLITKEEDTWLGFLGSTIGFIATYFSFSLFLNLKYYSSNVEIIYNQYFLYTGIVAFLSILGTEMYYHSRKINFQEII